MVEITPIWYHADNAKEMLTMLRQIGSIIARGKPFGLVSEKRRFWEWVRQQ